MWGTFLLSVVILLQPFAALNAAISDCVLKSPAPFYADEGSVVEGLFMPLSSTDCSCAQYDCAYSFTHLPAEGALYEMVSQSEGDSVYSNRTSPKLKAGDFLRASERRTFGSFLYVPSNKFQGQVVVKFNFTYGGLVSPFNFTIVFNFNNSVPYSGEGGHMLSFDGYDDFVVATVPLTNRLNVSSPAFSFSFWAKNTKYRSGQVLISAWAAAPSDGSAMWHAGRQWALFDTGNLNFQVNGESISEGTGFDIRDSKWHFVCLSWNIKSGLVDIFVDGEKKTIPVPQWKIPPSMILMLGNIQLVTEFIPVQKAENDVLQSRSLENADRNSADSLLSPSYAEKWYAAQTRASSLLSNLNGGMGSPKEAGTLAGIPSSYTDIMAATGEPYRYAMFGIADCNCAGYGAATKFAFGGHFDEFRMFSEARDTIDFSRSMNHMYTPTMFERFQTPDSGEATNAFAKGVQIKALAKLWIYWNFDYIWDFNPTDKLPIVESLRAGLLLQEASGSISTFDTRMRAVLDNTPQTTGIAGRLGEEYYSFRMPARVQSDAPLKGSVVQFVSAFPDARPQIINLAVEDWNNQTNILIRMESMPVIGSLFQVNEDESIGDPILARGTVITNSKYKIAYKGDRGLCKSGIKVLNLDGDQVDKDTAADEFDLYIRDVKIIPPVLDPDNPPALRFPKIIIRCAIYRSPVTLPNIVVKTLQNVSTMFELHALSLDTPTSTSLVITKLPSRGSIWTTRWIRLGCNDTSATCVCGDDALECNSGWNPRKECKNQISNNTKTYACLVPFESIAAGVRFDNPLNLIYWPAESFWGNDSMSYSAISNNNASFSQIYNEETVSIIVVPKAPAQVPSIQLLEVIKTVPAGDSVNISFNIMLDNVPEDTLTVRVMSFPLHGVLLLPSRINYENSDSLGVPVQQISKAFELTFDGFTKSHAITRIFPTNTTLVKIKLGLRNNVMSGDPTFTGNSYFSKGTQKFKGWDEMKASMNTSQTFESVCGDTGVVQSYVEFSAFFTVTSVRLMTSLPQDTFIRFVAPQNVLQANLTNIKRNAKYKAGSTQFQNCPESSCVYPWAYNARQSNSQHPNSLVLESSLPNVYSDQLFELWRGFAGQGQKSTTQNAIRDFFFPASLPTKFLIIESCGTLQSWPGLVNGGNPIDEVQGLIVRVMKGGNRGILPVGTRTLMYRSNPAFVGRDVFKLSLESNDGRVFSVAEANLNVTKSRALANMVVTNLQNTIGPAVSFTLANNAQLLRYELVSKSPEDLQMFRLDTTAINSNTANVFPDSSGQISIKVGSTASCGSNLAFASFNTVWNDGKVAYYGHNVSMSFVCPVGLVCDDTVKSCNACQPGTSYYDPPTKYDLQLSKKIPSGDCVPCLPGYYTDVPGQTVCKSCKPGFSSPPKSSMCFPCNPGTFSPSPGSLCFPCPPGKFQPHAGQSFCYSCGLLGFVANNNSIACADCPQNMHTEYEESSKVAYCTCNNGYYRLSRSNDAALTSDGSCLPCPQGAFCAGMDLLPVPINGFWSDVSLWSSGKSFFLQCFHRGVTNQCQGHPSIDYQYKHEICKFRDTDVCLQGRNDEDTFSSYTKNLACAIEYTGVLCFECSDGGALSSRNFAGACVLCPSNALGFVGIFFQSIVMIAMWAGILWGLVCRVHSLFLTLMHFQLLALLSDAAVQNSVAVDSFLKGFHLFMFDLNMVPWSCIVRIGFPLFLKHVVQLLVFWGAIAAVYIRGKKLVRDATYFRVQHNFKQMKISTDGINLKERRSLRSRPSYGDNTSFADTSSIGSANSKGDARSWKNLFKSNESQKSEIPVVDLLRPNTAHSAKSHDSWYSKVSAWRKQHVKAEDLRLESRKLMSTEEIDELRDEQYRALLAITQALAIPIVYNTLVLFPCLEYSDQVSRMSWIPTYQCTSSAHLLVSIVGVVTAIWFVVWIPGKFVYECATLWLQDDWDQPTFLKQYRRIFIITERKHRWWLSVLFLHGPLVTVCVILSQQQPAAGLTAALVWIGIKTLLTSYMKPYLMTKHNVYTVILDLHLSMVCSCALYRTNIFSTGYLAFTLDRFEVSADAMDGVIHVVTFACLLAVALFTIFIDCVYCKTKVPPWVAITFNVLTGKPHATFRTFLTNAWNWWQKLNRRYAKWVRPRTSLVQFGKDVQRAETRERADVVRDSVLKQNVAYPADSPFMFDTVDSDLGEWAAHPRKVYHFINACMIRIQELETVNSKTDKILALQSKVNCALRCLINFNRLDYEDAFQRQYVWPVRRNAQ